MQLTLEKIKRSELPDEIFVSLYHTDELIYSTAAKIIFDENPIKCFDYLANMSTKKQDLMNFLSNNDLLINDKIKYIKRFGLFFNIPENLLPKIAKIAKIKKIAKGRTLDLYENNEEHVFMISKGTLQFSVSDNYQKIFAKNDVIIRGLNVDNFATKLEVTADSVIIYFKRIDFFNTIISNKDIVRYILEDSEQLSWVLD